MQDRIVLIPPAENPENEKLIIVIETALKNNGLTAESMKPKNKASKTSATAAAGAGAEIKKM